MNVGSEWRAVRPESRRKENRFSPIAALEYLFPGLKNVYILPSEIQEF